MPYILKSSLVFIKESIITNKSQKYKNDITEQIPSIQKGKRSKEEIEKVENKEQTSGLKHNQTNSSIKCNLTNIPIKGKECQNVQH